ncbi:MAG: transcriptional regulator, LacI family [Paenibacillaceae bacterium]|nr:transcriptional regulator, LacI family [Paenibacillaceae bacterium]
MNRTVTVYDIAKEAGVSVATVSRVINSTAPVKATTRDKVAALIEKYHFQPNGLARSLLSKQSKMLGIIMPNIKNPFFPDVFRGAEIRAAKEGYALFLCNTLGNEETESAYLSILRDKQVDGILFLGGRVNRVRCPKDRVQEVAALNQRIPVVLVNGQLVGSGCCRVYTDEEQGMRMLVEHLLQAGHRRIGFLGGMIDDSTTKQKLKAFTDTLQAAGVEVREEWVLHGDYSMTSGMNVMNRLLELAERPTAVCCVNDFAAIGAIKALVGRGLRVPDDMAVAGFDDTPLASWYTPELTTVSQNSELLGETAIEVLLALIRKQSARKSTVLAPELVVRQSTGR